jgi:uncharacterized protein (DUF1800 family)
MPIQQTGRAWMESRGFDKVTLEEHYDSYVNGDFMVWNQLMTSPDAVRKRIAFALSEFFVVSTTSLAINWRSNAVCHFWDQLNDKAFGKFRELLKDVTLNPAMGVYLSTLGNLQADSNTNRVPDENFAREIMQLFTIGLYELNNDGSKKTNASGQSIETYTNNDVSNLAHVFTGYNYDFTGIGKTRSPKDPNRMVADVRYVYEPMTSDPTKWENPQATSEHSMVEKIFLGTTIPANTGPERSLELALDVLFNHPNVAPFFSTQMIQRLVTSNPTPAYVNRVANVFNDNGKGERGDLRAVFKAILLDEEAITPSNAGTPTAGKLREPALRLAQWGRTFGAGSKSGNWGISALSDPALTLGQSPLRAPSVFNFFRPGYVPPNTPIATNGFVAPEFQLVNEVTVAGYVNFMISALKGEMTNTGWDVGAKYTSEIAIAHNSGALLDRLCLLLAANQISASTKTTIKEALDSSVVVETSHPNTKLKRVQMAILLVMASPDYLVQK